MSDKLREAADRVLQELHGYGYALQQSVASLRAALADSGPQPDDELRAINDLAGPILATADAPPSTNPDAISSSLVIGEPTDEMVDQRTKSDCFLACIASLTGLPVSEMPQPPTSYENLTSDGEPTEEDREAEVQYGNAVRRHLRECGWLLLNAYSFAPAGHSIASGPSPRNPRIWHCVVYRDGELAHDPHSSRAGIVSVEQYEIVVRAGLAVQQKGEG